LQVVPGRLYDASAYCITPFLSDLRRLERENQALMMPPMSVKIVPKVCARVASSVRFCLLSGWGLAS